MTPSPVGVLLVMMRGKVQQFFSWRDEDWSIASGHGADFLEMELFSGSLEFKKRCVELNHATQMETNIIKRE